MEIRLGDEYDNIDEDPVAVMKEEESGTVACRAADPQYIHSDAT